MAALRKETPTKSLFSSPSHCLKKLVNNTVGSFSDSHKQRVAEEEEVIDGLPSEPVLSEDEDESSAEEEDESEYSDSSDSQYPRPRIREDLLPHDFFQWQKSPCGSVARSAPSEASSTSKEAETFSEAPSTSTSCASEERHFGNGHLKRSKGVRPADVGDGRSSYMTSTVGPSHIGNARHPSDSNFCGKGQSSEGRKNGRNASLRGISEERKSWKNGAGDRDMGYAVDGWKEKLGRAAAGGRLREMMQEVAGAGNGDVDMKLYQNLVEMFPLIETLMSQEHPRRSSFLHHASMVYTRAPSRDSHVKQIAESPGRLRRAKKFANGNKESNPVWEERENMLRRIEAEEESSSSPRSVSCEDIDGTAAADIAKLQGQVEELKRQLWEKDCMLEQLPFTAENMERESEILNLSRKIEELQLEVAEKELISESASLKLYQKEDEISRMQQLLQNVELSKARLNERSANNEEELKALRCEVAALRYQLESSDTKKMQQGRLWQQGASEPNSPQNARKPLQKMSNTKEHSELVELQQKDMEQMETARRMYLAAIVAARQNSGEECLVLVGELRMQLQSFLRRSFFLCAKASSPS